MNEQGGLKNKFQNESAKSNRNLWAEVDKNLKQKRRRRILFFWWIGLGGILFLSSIFYAGKTWIEFQEQEKTLAQTETEGTRVNPEKTEEFQAEKQANLLKSNQLEKIQNEDDVKEVEPVPNNKDTGESGNPPKSDSKKITRGNTTINKPNVSKEATLVKQRNKYQKAPLLALEGYQKKQEPHKNKEIDKGANIPQIAANEIVGTNSPIVSDKKDFHGNEKVIVNPESNIISKLDSVDELSQQISKIAELKKDTLVEPTRENEKVILAQKDSSQSKPTSRLQFSGFAGVYYSAKNQVLNVNGEQARTKNLAKDEFSNNRIGYSIDLLILYEMGKNWSLFTSIAGNYIADKSRFSIRGNNIKGYSNQPDQNGFDLIRPEFEETEKKISTQVFSLETQVGIWIKKVLPNVGLKLSPAISFPAFTNVKTDYTGTSKNENAFFAGNLNLGLHVGLPISLPLKSKEIYIEPHFSRFLNPVFKPTSGVKNSPLLFGVKIGSIF